MASLALCDDEQTGGDVSELEVRHVRLSPERHKVLKLQTQKKEKNSLYVFGLSLYEVYISGY